MLPSCGNATYFDGQTAQARAVTLRLAMAALVMEDADGGTIETLALKTLFRVPYSGDIMRIGSSDLDPLARIDVADPSLQRAIRDVCPQIDQLPRTAARQRRRVVGWSIAAVLGLIAVTVIGLPLLTRAVVPLIPVSVEKQIGASVEVQLRQIMALNVDDNSSCYVGHEDTPGGRALTKLVRRINDGIDTIAVEPSVDVWPAAFPNALALPGGRVLLLEPLIKAAVTPDELAAVIAHEFGHVDGRDTMHTVVHGAGLGLVFGVLLGDFSGGWIVAGAVKFLLESGYSREKEIAADDYAVDVMNRVGGDARALAAILQRLTGDETDVGSGMEYARSHPITKKRVERILARAGTKPPVPMLSGEEWRALQAICR